MTNKYNPWASYHTEYTRRLERDRAIVERDEARAWARRMKQERDNWENTANLYCRNAEYHRQQRDVWRACAQHADESLNLAEADLDEVTAQRDNLQQQHDEMENHSVWREQFLGEQKRRAMLGLKVQDLRQQRDELKAQNAELVAALKAAITELEKSSLDALSLDRIRERNRVWVILRDTLAKLE